MLGPATHAFACSPSLVGLSSFAQNLSVIIAYILHFVFDRTLSRFFFGVFTCYSVIAFNSRSVIVSTKAYGVLKFRRHEIWTTIGCMAETCQYAQVTPFLIGFPFLQHLWSCIALCAYMLLLSWVFVLKCLVRSLIIDLIGVLPQCKMHG
jgi:hypothetical protein